MANQPDSEPCDGFTLEPLQATASADEVSNVACELIIEQYDRLRRLIADVPDATLLEAADELEDQSSCIGFRVEEMDSMAIQLRSEVATRAHFAAARQSNASWYCVCCHGQCDGGPKHEANAEKLSPRKTPEEMAIRSMHREKLIEALLEARGCTRKP